MSDQVPGGKMKLEPLLEQDRAQCQDRKPSEKEIRTFVGPERSTLTSELENMRKVFVWQNNMMKEKLCTAVACHGRHCNSLSHVAGWLVGHCQGYSATGCGPWK